MWEYGWAIEHDAIQWEETVWLRIGGGGKEVKSGYNQFVSVMIIDIVDVFDCSSGFPKYGEGTDFSIIEP